MSEECARATMRCSQRGWTSRSVGDDQHRRACSKRRGYVASRYQPAVVDDVVHLGTFHAQHSRRRSPEDPGSGHHCNSQMS